jgi:hypothetical protein
MATAERISGNPRLIKRFLNTLSVDALALPSLSEPCADRRPELVAPFRLKPAVLDEQA